MDCEWVMAGAHFRAFLAEVTDAFETNSHPSALWAKWIDVVVKRTRPEDDKPPR